MISGDEQYDGLLVATNDYWGDPSGPSGDGPGTGEALWADGDTGHFVVPVGIAGGSVTFSPWATALIPITGYGAPAAPTGAHRLIAASTTSASRWRGRRRSAPPPAELVQRDRPMA